MLPEKAANRNREGSGRACVIVENTLIWIVAVRQQFGQFAISGARRRYESVGVAVGCWSSAGAAEESRMPPYYGAARTMGGLFFVSGKVTTA